MMSLRNGIALAAATLAICAGCTTTSDPQRAVYSNPYAGVADFGDEFSVQSAVVTVKREGDHTQLASTALRLPERPLSEIESFTYQFPEQCGGHEFAVYEADDTQILEYRHVDLDGTVRIRDYVAHDHPFVEPGLWGAYDHTAGGVKAMNAQVVDRGDKMFAGSYSQGFVTGLPQAQQDALGDAYRRALSDVLACGALSAL